MVNSSVRHIALICMIFISQSALSTADNAQQLSQIDGSATDRTDGMAAVRTKHSLDADKRGFRPDLDKRADTDDEWAPIGEDELQKLLAARPQRSRSSFRGDLGKRPAFRGDLGKRLAIGGDERVADQMTEKRTYGSAFRGDLGKRKSSFRGDLGKRNPATETASLYGSMMGSEKDDVDMDKRRSSFRGDLGK